MFGGGYEYLHTDYDGGEPLDEEERRAKERGEAVVELFLFVFVVLPLLANILEAMGG